MPGHDGLFARQLPIASACFSHVDVLGIRRRRFDLFAIVRLALAIVVGVLLLMTRLIGLGGEYVSAGSHGWLIIGAVLQHRPSHARGLVGHRHCRDVRVATRCQPGHPLTESIILIFGSAEHRSRTVNQ